METTEKEHYVVHTQIQIYICTNTRYTGREREAERQKSVESPHRVRDMDMHANGMAKSGRDK